MRAAALLVAVGAAAPARGAATFFPASRSEFALSGRRAADSDGVTFDWAAGSVVFTVRGATSCAAHLTSLSSRKAAADKFNVLTAEGTGPLGYADFAWNASAPGGAWHPVYVRTNTTAPVPVTSPLDAAQTYSVWLFKGTEPYNNDFGAVRFAGVECEGAAPELLPAVVPWREGRRLEVIGDSITAGFGAQGDGGTGGGPYGCAGGGYGNENAFVTWGAQLARNVSAELHLEAWSAIGLVKNAGGAAQTKYNMSTLFRATLGSHGPTDDANQWDFSSWVPSAVISDLGTNDFGSNGIIPNDTWTGAYRGIAATMRAKYGPKVPLVLFCSPWGVKGLCQANSAAAATLTAEGHVVHAVEYDERTAHVPRSHDGCGGHPALLAHQFMSEFMSPVIAGLLGWE